MPVVKKTVELKEEKLEKVNGGQYDGIGENNCLSGYYCPECDEYIADDLCFIGGVTCPHCNKFVTPIYKKMKLI